MAISRFNPRLLISKNDKDLAVAIEESPLIAKALEGGATLSEVIIILHGFIKDLIEENMRLDQIAPYKTHKDGKVVIVMPPEDVIPFKVFKVGPPQADVAEPEGDKPE